MWKVFGEEGVMVQFGLLWKERMIELSKRRKDRDRFLELLEKAEISHYLDIHQRLHVFRMDLPPTCTPEDVEFLKGFVQRILKSTPYPMVDLDGEEQKAALVISAEEPEDEHTSRMSEWYKMKQEEDRKRQGN
ncbi:MAG: hypothetical protein AB9819_01400 [Methanomassiliicoccales archaeon]